MAVLEVALQGVTNVSHRVKVSLNNVEAGEVLFMGQSPGSAKWSVPQSLLLEGEDLVTLVSAGGDMDISLVAYIRLTYWRAYTADGEVLRFTANEKRQVTVGGFGSPRIRVVDI